MKKQITKFIRSIGNAMLIGLVIALIGAFFFATAYLQVWACQDLHPNASVLACLLDAGSKSK